MKKVSVLFSAGVESSSLLVHYLEEGFLVLPLYVRCGLPWERRELRWAERLWAVLKKRHKKLLPLRVLPMVGVSLSRGKLEIPMRNLTLTVGVVAESYRRGIRRIAIGSLGIYPFSDNNREYFDALENIVSRGVKERVSIETPFMGLEKWEVIGRFWGKVPYRLTFSCMRPKGDTHCGVCPKCLERKEGFRKAGVPDPTLYASS